MLKIKLSAGQILGIIGTAAFVLVFVNQPSFPTPDKIIVFLLFVFMIFGQAIFMLKRLLPFVIVLLVYDSFRGLADELNNHVNYSLAPAADRWLFGILPTVALQDWLWNGAVRWYDYALYLPYMLHFILPLGLAVLIWKVREKAYWNFIAGFMFVTLLAFVTFLAFPAAPPWLASEAGAIQEVARISSHVWSGLGIEDFPSFYNHISPNPVAAVPSHHAAWATLIFLYVWKCFGRRWAVLAALYPAVIFFGTVYQGEHYTFDVIVGVIYAVIAYLAAPYLVRGGEAVYQKIRRVFSSSTKTAPKSRPR